MRRNKGNPGLVAAGLGWGLAAGVALGALLLAPALNAVNEGHADAPAASSADDARDTAAREEAAAANELVGSKSAELVDGALDGASVIMLRTSAVPEDEASKQRWLLNKAGSDDAGSIVLTEKFTSQEAADELNTIIANTLPAGAQLSVDNRAPGVHAGEALSAALSKDESGQPRASVEDREFLLDTLAEAGFIEYQPGSVIAADGAVVLAGAGDGEQSFGRDALENFAGAFRTQGPALVVASPGPKDGTTASPEVGFAGTETGRVNTVLALRDELRTAR